MFAHESSKTAVRFMTLIPFLVAVLLSAHIASAQTYQINANGWLGTLEIHIEGNAVNGVMHFYQNRAGNKVDQRSIILHGRVQSLSKATFITFEREGSKQTYFGWISKNGDFLAGYFESGDKKPWYGTR